MDLVSNTRAPYFCTSCCVIQSNQKRDSPAFTFKPPTMSDATRKLLPAFRLFFCFLSLHFLFQISLPAQESADSTYHLAIQLIKKKDYPKATATVKKALIRYEQSGNTRGQAIALNALGALSLLRKEYNQAAVHLKKAMFASGQIKDSVIISDIHFNLGLTWEARNDFADALQEYQLAKVLLNKTNGHWGEPVLFRMIDNQQSQTERYSSILEGERRVQAELQKTVRYQEIIVALLSLAVFLLLAGIVFYRQRRISNALHLETISLMHAKMVDALVKKQEIKFANARLAGERESRRRIAEHLHDSVGALFFALKWKLESIAHKTPANHAELAGQLASTIADANHVYNELRKVERDLRPNPLDWYRGLTRFCEMVSKDNIIDATISAHDLDEFISPSTGNEIQYIVQELITNVLKHAKAATLNVQINRIDDHLHVIVEDDGTGFDPRKTYEGSGLSNIRRRVEERLHGVIEWDTGKGVGTTVIVKTPISIDIAAM